MKAAIFQSSNIIKGVKMSEDKTLFLIDEFQEGRIEKIKRGETLVPLTKGPRVIFHLIPFKALQMDVYHDLSIYDDEPLVLTPLKLELWNKKYSFDGLVIFSETDFPNCISYILFCGNGIIESALGSFFGLNQLQIKIINITELEEAIIKMTRVFLSLLKRLGDEPPIFMYMNVLGASGYNIAAPSSFRPENVRPVDIRPIERDHLKFQRLSIKSFEDEPEKLLKTWFDRLWNAGGYPFSAYYDKSGNRVKK
jgi:hypothetical protein